MSHGRLIHHDLSSTTDLAQVALADLGAELLRRLEAGAEHESRQSLERNLHLLSRLHDLTEALLDVQENRASVANFAAQFEFVRHCWRKHGVPMAGATHVDVGCGALQPLARLFTHAMLGVERAIGIDLDRPTEPAVAARHLARLAAAAILDPASLYGDFPITGRDVLANLHGFDLAKLRRGDPAGVDATRATLLHRPIEATGLATASVDVVISNSVLEHLSDVDAALRELARITRPGGYGIHGIDTIDHRWYGEPTIHPLDFLTIDTRDPIVFECNRIRLVEFPALFRRHGFEVVDYAAHRTFTMTPDFRARLLAPWQGLDDAVLEATWANVLVRRLPG